MIRTTISLMIGFLLLLGLVVGLVFGNPLKLEGAKFQEFAGYIMGILLSAVGLLVIMYQSILRAARLEPKSQAQHLNAQRGEVVQAR